MQQKWEICSKNDQKFNKNVFKIKKFAVTSKNIKNMPEQIDAKILKFFRNV